MDFSLTGERRMLSETLTRWLADSYPVTHRNAVAYDLPGHDPAKWAELAELGALYALAPEAAGGFGGAGADIAVVFEPLGAALCPEPVLGALMAARLLAAAGEDLEPLLTGARRYAFAIDEPDAPWDPADIACTADASGRLSGRKTSIYGGASADTFLVAARESDGIGLYAVDASDAPVVHYVTMDGGGAAELMLDATPARRILSDAGPAIADALDAGRVALSAEAVGIMGWLHATTVGYLAERKQFGRPIGSFQALQHRAVDMACEIEQARSITIKAAAELGGPEAGRFAEMAKHLIGRAGRQIAEESIQMHGGIAMTWEYPVSHYAKRLIMIDHQLGDTDFHLTRLMAA
jgi:alkylation response protein AidB-like acyl-CoA dehydrogenase